MIAWRYPTPPTKMFPAKTSVITAVNHWDCLRSDSLGHAGPGRFDLNLKTWINAAAPLATLAVVEASSMIA